MLDQSINQLHGQNEQNRGRAKREEEWMKDREREKERKTDRKMERRKPSSMWTSSKILLSPKTTEVVCKVLCWRFPTQTVVYFNYRQITASMKDQILADLAIYPCCVFRSRQPKSPNKLDRVDHSKSRNAEIKQTWDCSIINKKCS